MATNKIRGNRTLLATAMAASLLLGAAGCAREGGAEASKDSGVVHVVCGATEDWCAATTKKFTKSTGVKADFVPALQRRGAGPYQGRQGQRGVRRLVRRARRRVRLRRRRGAPGALRLAERGCHPGQVQGPAGHLDRRLRRRPGLLQQQQAADGAGDRASRLVDGPAQPEARQGHRHRAPVHLGHRVHDALDPGAAGRRRRGQGAGLHAQAAPERAAVHQVRLGARPDDRPRRGRGRRHLLARLRGHHGGRLPRPEAEFPGGGHRIRDRRRRPGEERQEPGQRPEVHRLGAHHRGAGDRPDASRRTSSRRTRTRRCRTRSSRSPASRWWSTTRWRPARRSRRSPSGSTPRSRRRRSHDHAVVRPRGDHPPHPRRSRPRRRRRLGAGLRVLVGVCAACWW